MQTQERVSDAVVRRLPGYYRNLTALEAQGILRISSQALGKRMGLTASQIRQDMNCFGGFGQQGYGYHVPNLRQCIGQIIGIHKTHRMIVIGIGNIGSAIVHYPTFQSDGFEMLALFDNNASRIGQTIEGLTIRAVDTLESFLAAQSVDIVILSTPAESAQALVHRIANTNIRAIWNFTPVDLIAPDTIEIANVHLSDSLMALTFRLHEREVRSQKSPQWLNDNSQNPAGKE